jgi:HSP20 family protein
MALIKWESLRDIEDLFDRYTRGLGWPGGRPPVLASQAEWSPRVDITEKDGEFVIKADLPGVAREDLKVTVEKGVLTLQGERRQEKKEDNERFHRVERFYGHFLRSFTLPEGVDETQVKANISDGQLSVTVPKTQPAAPSTPVEVPVQ